jgi:hypothetical protein
MTERFEGKIYYCTKTSYALGSCKAVFYMLVEARLAQPQRITRLGAKIWEVGLLNNKIYLMVFATVRRCAKWVILLSGRYCYR